MRTAADSLSDRRSVGAAEWRVPNEISLLTDREKLHARLDRPFDVAELTAGLSNGTFLAAHP